MTMPKTILVGTDFSELGDRATAYACELAKQLGAQVTLLHAWSLQTIGMPEGFVLPIGSMNEELEAAAQKGANAALERHRGFGVPLSARVVCADARDAIVEAAKALPAELIVLGSHGRTGVRRALLGSVAESVIRHAPCPVLVVR